MAQVLVQQVYNRFTGYVTGSTQIPADNSRPQNTEGDEYMAVNFTPKFANSTLEIEVYVCGSLTTGGAGSWSVALFRGLDTDCKAAITVGASTDRAHPATLKHFEPAGMAGTPIRFAVRIGPTAATTFHFNGIPSTPYFNGTVPSYILIREWNEEILNINGIDV